MSMCVFIHIMYLSHFSFQSIVAQVTNLQLQNGGLQNSPVDFSQNFNGQPAGNNFQAINTIPFINTLPINVNGNVNGLQMIPNLPFTNVHINELLNFPGNNRQLVGNNPSAYTQNAPVNNDKLFQSNNNLPINNNPYLPVNNVNPNNNNLHNSVLTNNFIPPANNLPVYNNPLNSNNMQQNINIPFSNMPNSNKPPIINSLILTGQAFNNGLPFNVLPANTAYNINDLSVNNNEGSYNVLKIPRSLPGNEITESGFPVSYNMIENNGVAAWQRNEGQLTNLPLNNINSNILPVNNGWPLNNGLPFNTPVASNFNNVPTELPLNNGYTANMPLNNGELLNKFAVNHFNNIHPNNEQLVSSNYQMPSSNDWIQPINHIQSYQNNELPMANLPVSNVGLSQPTGNKFNLPDTGNMNMLHFSEFGNMPIFSGLPVIGITETVTVLNPDQLNQMNQLSHVNQLSQVVR